MKVLTNSITQAKANINNRSNKHIKTRHKITVQENDYDNEINLRHVSERGKDGEVEHQHIDGSERQSDFLNNTTYAKEDSLSIFKGTVKGVSGDVWVVTDSGSMTQLMQRDYAKKMKFKIDDLPRDKYFNIVGPGGGRNKVTQRVTITVNVMMERCLSLVENYVTGERDLKVSAPEEKQITMTFGLVDSLPVPILWGGGQMRKRDLLDDHGRKTLSLLLDNNERWQMPSLSWLVSCAQMKLAVEENKEVYAPLIPFIPSRDLLSGMAMGERLAYNLPGMLAPRRSTVLKVSRNNARAEVKDRKRKLLSKNLKKRRIRERNDWESLGLTLDKKMSFAATRLQRRKERSSQGSDSSEESTEERRRVPVGKQGIRVPVGEVRVPVGDERVPVGKDSRRVPVGEERVPVGEQGRRVPVGKKEIPSSPRCALRPSLCLKLDRSLCYSRDLCLILNL